jgi:hypothetical protein
MNLFPTLLLLGATALRMLDTALPAQSGNLIDKHKVGEVTIGFSADDLYDSLPAERRRLVDLRHEGHLSPALELTLARATRPFGVIAELGCQERQGLVVTRLMVIDPAFRTEKGLGVGSTVGELRAAYALGSFSTEEGSAGVVVEALSATFVLDQRGIDLTRFRTGNALPESVKVIGVLLWK